MYHFSTRRIGRFLSLPIIAVGVLAGTAPGHAQQIVYEPINPSFGGDSFNSAHLLGIANAQNDYSDPNRPSTQNSQTDLFLRQLQSRLLSSLANQVSEAIFGENPQDSGTITFGDQVIEFNRGLESVQLVITDNLTGSRTEIEIPILLTTQGTTATTSGGASLAELLGAQSSLAGTPLADVGGSQ